MAELQTPQPTKENEEAKVEPAKSDLPTCRQRIISCIRAWLREHCMFENISCPQPSHLSPAQILYSLSLLCASPLIDLHRTWQSWKYCNSKWTESVVFKGGPW